MRFNLKEDYFNENQAVLDLHGGEKYLGRVEVCIMTAYHTVCYNDQEDSYAPTICKQLGFSPYGKIFLCPFLEYNHANSLYRCNSCQKQIFL